METAIPFACSDSATVCLTAAGSNITGLSTEVYDLVCRSDFQCPGFCVLQFQDADSWTLRAAMLNLRAGLSAIHQQRAGLPLGTCFLSRFDQQTTTRLHLDGGPEESLLLLGFEPSPVDSFWEVADYARCAFDLGLTPSELLARHNPLFPAGAEALRPYTCSVPGFDTRRPRIVCLNNSSAPWDTSRPRWQGLLHAARIPCPDPAARRVVNSMMLAPWPPGTEEPVSPAQIADFRTTSVVLRRGYDQPHLVDDP